MFDWLRRARPASASDKGRPEETVAPAPGPTAAPTPAPTAAPAPSDPVLARAEFQRASQALARGDKSEAEQHLHRALAAQPDHVDALTNLGALLKDSRRPDEAEAMFRRALAADGRAGIAAFNLAWLLMDRRQWTEAANLLRTAASVMPKDAEVHCFLGNALMGLGDAEAARRAYQTAVRHNARHSRARWGLTMAQLPAIASTAAEQARAPQAFAQELGKLKAWFRAQPTVGGSSTVGAQQPYYLAYVEADHRAVLRDYGALCASLMGGWARRVGVPAPATGGGPKWKLGIVSSHVISHSVWHALLRGWIEHLDPSRFEIHLFHTGSGRDAETEWAARRVTQLHQAVGDWKAWARCISEQRLDALIYPEIGMDTTTTRLAALRLARLQVAAWGHPITTGLPTIDAYLSAEAFEPEGAPAHYAEQLIALPRLGCCYQPYGTVPASVDFARAGIAANDRVLLCPGTPFKYTPQHDGLWIEIARRCAPCKLVFFRPAGSSLSELFESRLRAAFAAAGVDADSTLRFLPWQSQAAFFAWLDRADVFLDTPGFSGFNTVMQALERGAPVVAWEGRFMRGRFASGVLRQAGLSPWIAADAAGYLERVERLCVDEALRRQVRRDVATAAPRLYQDRAGVGELARYLQERLSQA